MIGRRIGLALVGGGGGVSHLHKAEHPYVGGDAGGVQHPLVLLRERVMGRGRVCKEIMVEIKHSRDIIEYTVVSFANI